MAITLIDGTVLPDVPSVYAEEYPYHVVTKEYGTYVEETLGWQPPLYTLYLAKANIVYAPASVWGGDYPKIVGTTDGRVTYKYTQAGTDWGAQNVNNFYKVGCVIGDVSDAVGAEYVCDLVWSNHDILTATAMNSDGTYVIGTEIYFPNSSAPAYEYSDVYIADTDWIIGVADQARRLGGTTEKLDDAGILAALQGAAGEPELTEATVTPSRTASVMLPPEGFVGFSKVNVKAARLENMTVIPGVTDQTLLPIGDSIGLFQVIVKAAKLEEATVTPTTEEQVLTPSGDNIGFSKVTVLAAAIGETLQSAMEVGF